MVLVAAVVVATGCPTKDNPMYQLTEGGSSDGDQPVPSTSGVGSESSASGPGGTAGTSATTTAGTTSGGTTSTAGDDGSTGEQNPAGLCDDFDLLYTQPFDILPPSSSAWDVEVEGDPELSIVDGALYIEFPTQGGDSPYWVLVGQETIPPQGFTGVEVVVAPPTNEEAEVYVGLNDDNSLIYITATDGELQAWWYDDNSEDYTPLHSVPYDPNEHRWIRMYWDAPVAEIIFETSSDGETWTFFEQIDATDYDFDFAFGSVEAGLGAWGDVSVFSDAAAMDNVFLCGDR